MAERDPGWAERLARLDRIAFPLALKRQPEWLSPATSLIGLTSSRLGHDPHLHRHVCQFLSRCLLDSRHQDAAFLVAIGSAIEPWALRAAELFGATVVRLSVDTADPAADLVLEPTAGQSTRPSRDAATIALADHVDAVHVRRGGTIARCLHRRLADQCDGSVRVAVSMLPGCAAAELIAAGAIGWYLAGRHDAAQRPHPCHFEPPAAEIDAGWTQSSGQWLIHCTRGRCGPWPGETERQYRDWLILGGPSSTDRSPLDALLRIVRSGVIVASATASCNKYPVVCFSARELRELLRRRCFRPHLRRWDYEPYGIAIRFPAARRLGIMPVIYGNPNSRSMLSAGDQFRFHPVGETFDWREEQEWRSRGSVDLTRIDPQNVRVFATHSPEAVERLRGCRWPVTFLSAVAETGKGV